jgi:hypothetical protein
VLLSYVMKMRQKLNIYNLSLILNAFATLAPDNPKYLADLGPELHDRLSAAVNTETFRVTPEKIGEMEGKVEELTPDLTAYSNLWLSLACFGVKGAAAQEGEDEDKPEVRAKGLIRVLAKDLVKVFNGNKRWKATDMNVAEAATISIAIASLKLEGAGPMDRFIADIGDVIRANLKDASGMDLVNLAKATFYMRKFEHTRDLYSHVHAECTTRKNLRELEVPDVEALAKVFTGHGVFSDSPFVSVRVSR